MLFKQTPGWCTGRNVYPSMVKTEEFIPNCTYNTLCRKHQNTLKDILIADVHFLISLFVITNT